MTVTDDIGVETTAADEFAGRMFGAFNDGALCLLLSLGHRLGLLDTLATLPPSTSTEIAAAARLDERYVREWLDGLTAAQVTEHDPATQSYWLPAEHAASLTEAAGANNVARMSQLIPLLAAVEESLVGCFRSGGGVGYAAFPRFHELMAADSRAVHDAGLLDVVVPLVPRLVDRLTRGATVADVGCGSGHAMNLLARAYPASEFVGFDFAEAAIAAARREAGDWQLTNVSFEVRDVADLAVHDRFDVVTAFDVIHDLAHPARVLSAVHHSLRPDGLFLMVDIRASSNVDENVDLPWATFLYTVSLMHCMTVSLSQGGDGLGTAWGHQTARRMLREAGFSVVDLIDVETDPVNAYYVARKG